MDNLENYSELLRILKEEKTAFAAFKAVEVGQHLYQPRAFVFLMMALKRAGETHGKNDPALTEGERHLTGQELLESVRTLGLEMFGHLAEMVFAHWGVHRTEDWGEIVFLLVETGVLKKTDRDSRLDFARGYDFASAFRPPDYWKHLEVEAISLPPWDAEPEAADNGAGDTSS